MTTLHVRNRVARRAADLALAGRLVLAAVDPTRPIIVHLCVTRRCNLSCAYCFEYDDSSPPVPLRTLMERVNHLARLRAAMINLNGGEPLLHPEITDLVAYVRERGMVPVMNSNGFALNARLVRELGDAGLHSLQISVDSIDPSETTKKAWRPLEEKLRLLREEASFRVRINTVLGSGPPAEAVEVARRALDHGFDAKCSFVRGADGAMLPLDSEARQAYRAIIALGRRSPPLLREDFMESLFQDGTRRWKCRSGGRYFWICEKGLVHFCESSYGDPAIPLEEYSVDHIKRFFGMKKSCSPTCAVAYAHQASRLDGWRPQPDETRQVAKRSWLGGR